MNNCVEEHMLLTPAFDTLWLVSKSNRNLAISLFGVALYLLVGMLESTGSDASFSCSSTASFSTSATD
jgi:hypothetical protein